MYVYVYALRLKMKDVRKRKDSQAVKREKRGRGRQKGLRSRTNTKMEAVYCRDGRGGRRQFVWAVRNQARKGPSSEHGWLKLGQSLNGAH